MNTIFLRFQRILSRITVAKAILFALLGGLGGMLYFYFIGCRFRNMPDIKQSLDKLRLWCGNRNCFDNGKREKGTISNVTVYCPSFVSIDRKIITIQIMI